MHKVTLAALVLLGLVGSVGFFSSPAQAGGPLPPNVRSAGVVYDGLTRDLDGSCAGGYKFTFTLNGKLRTQCTHGPDPMPDGRDVSAQTAPLPAKAKPTLLRPSQVNAIASSGIVCDGDGVTGRRTQVLYVRASDVADRFSAYQASIQQWAADADQVYDKSAAETGSSRHIRFVHDSNCNIQVESVVLSPAGDDTVGNMVNELVAQGYSRLDRKYMVFMDAHVYCGISGIAYDDQPGAANANNDGATYSRIDNGCWSGVIAAHEHMHMLGGVQITAPHSDANWHCTDGYDDMCDHGGKGLTLTNCSNPVGDSRFDCNHDDYYHTNPAAGSYLATHWNAANSLWLIAPGAPAVDLLVPTLRQQRSGPSPVQAGASITTSAIITGTAAGGPVSGNVRFYVCSKPITGTLVLPDCSQPGTGTAVGSQVPVMTLNTTPPSGTATSNSVTARGGQAYCFRAEYGPALSTLYVDKQYANQVTTGVDASCFYAQTPTNVTMADFSARTDAEADHFLLGLCGGGLVLLGTLWFTSRRG